MAEKSTTKEYPWMARAVELAQRGRGSVEPNPMVGCVIVQDGEVVGEGWHQEFGGPHAEIEALQAAQAKARGADVYVTLEPCCHTGKTGPCTTALIDAGVKRVVVGCEDPNPQVAGKGMAALREAGIKVTELADFDDARHLIAPFAKLTRMGQPWIIAKWAMTLDGKIATRTGSSRWISGEESRALVHQIRGCVDGILIGRGTAVADDPLLTARPSGPRVATRIVLDTTAALSLESQLVKTAAEIPLLIATSEKARDENIEKLEIAGAEVLVCLGESSAQRLAFLLDELGRRQMTNILIEGGPRILGKMFDTSSVDEVLVFVAPKLVGGREAVAAVGGNGIAEMSDALRLDAQSIEPLGDDVLLRGRVHR